MAMDESAFRQALDNLHGLKEDVLSEDLDQRLTAVVTLRRMLSRGALLGGQASSPRHTSHAHTRTERDPPIDQVICAGIVPALAALLHNGTEDRLLVRVVVVGVLVQLATRCLCASSWPSFGRR